MELILIIVVFLVLLLWLWNLGSRQRKKSNIETHQHSTSDSSTSKQVEENAIPDYYDWLIEKSKKNVPTNLEDSLNEYIETYNVIFRNEPDEPKRVWLARTKLKILNKNNVTDLFSDSSEKINSYIKMKKMVVDTYESMNPEEKKRAQQIWAEDP